MIRLMKMRKTVSIILVLSITLAQALSRGAAAQEKDLDQSISKKESELDSLRKQIAERRKLLKDLENRERNESEYLRRLREEESLTRQLLEGLEEKREMLEEQVTQLRADLDTSEAIYLKRLEVLSGRLRKIYMDGPRNTWKELLSANDFSDLFQRYKFLSMVAERDADLVADIRERKEEIEMQEAQITELLHEVTTSRNEKGSELSKLQDNENKRKRALSRIQSDKKEHERKIEELARAERQLLSIIDELEKARLEQAKAWGDFGEVDFQELRGRMEKPVTGAVVREFGRFKHPEYGTVTYNTGIDIEARPGEPVRSVGRGRIEYAGELPGYGSCIIVNHGGGYYTLYAHTSQIFVEQGQQVERGSLIAEAGSDEAGREGVLHFEIRQSKKALDPGEWIKKGGR